MKHFTNVLMYIIHCLVYIVWLSQSHKQTTCHLVIMQICWKIVQELRGAIVITANRSTKVILGKI